MDNFSKIEEGSNVMIEQPSQIEGLTKEGLLKLEEQAAKEKLLEEQLTEDPQSAPIKKVRTSFLGIVKNYLY